MSDGGAMGYLACILPVAVIVALVLFVCAIAGRIDRQQEMLELCQTDRPSTKRRR